MKKKLHMLLVCIVLSSPITLTELCQISRSLTTMFFFQQWIALVTTPQGWKMPEKSKIMFKNTGPPDERFKYSFCEVKELQHVTMTDYRKY